MKTAASQMFAASHLSMINEGDLGRTIDVTASNFPGHISTLMQTYAFGCGRVAHYENIVQELTSILATLGHEGQADAVAVLAETRVNKPADVVQGQQVSIAHVEKFIQGEWCALEKFGYSDTDPVELLERMGVTVVCD